MAEGGSIATEPRADSPEFARWLRSAMTRGEVEALPSDTAAALRRFGTRRSHQRGETLLRQGDEPTELLIVEGGDVELVHDTGPERAVVQILHAGSCVEPLAVIVDEPYRYSAVTLNDATLLWVRLDAIRALEELYPEIALRWLRLAGHALGRAHQRIVELAARSALQQVSQLLLHEAAERNLPTVELTQGQLAETLAVSRQTVSRAFRDLAREGAIKAERRRVRLIDVAKLRSHVEQ